MREPDSLDEEALQEMTGRDERAGDVTAALLELSAEYEDQLRWAHSEPRAYHRKGQSRE